MSAELGKGVQVEEVVARIARNDPTMTNANLSGECAAADGAAAVALLQMQQGRERGVDCVCATEPPWCSSGCKVTDAGAAAIARALEKNTTLKWLDFDGEFVVLCCVCGGGLIVVYVVVGCCWFVFLGLGACAWC